jgi:hypothetical protein
VAFCTAKAARGLVLPTIPQLAQQMRHLVPPDKSLFYSGPGLSGYKPQAQYYSREYGFKTIWDVGDPANLEIAQDLGKVNLYWKRMSAAYSVVSRGKVWVLLPDDPALGTSWFAGTIWDTLEWPILEQNTAVTEIFRVNPLTLPAEGINIKPVWTIPPRHLE